MKKDKITSAPASILAVLPGKLRRERSDPASASIVANPLVRNKVIFLDALATGIAILRYHDALVLLEAKVRLQNHRKRECPSGITWKP